MTKEQNTTLCFLIRKLISVMMLLIFYLNQVTACLRLPVKTLRPCMVW